MITNLLYRLSNSTLKSLGLDDMQICSYITVVMYLKCAVADFGVSLNFDQIK
jgi:hypothetical protein